MNTTVGLRITGSLPQILFPDMHQSEAQIVAAQKAIIDNESILPGPTTDDLIDYKYRTYSAGNYIHMNNRGLKISAQRWSNILSDYFRHHNLVITKK